MTLLHYGSNLTRKTNVRSIQKKNNFTTLLQCIEKIKNVTKPITSVWGVWAVRQAGIVHEQIALPGTVGSRGAEFKSQCGFVDPGQLFIIQFNLSQ